MRRKAEKLEIFEAPLNHEKSVICTSSRKKVRFSLLRSGH